MFAKNWVDYLKLFKVNFDPWNKLLAQLKGKFSSNTL